MSKIHKWGNWGPPPDQISNLVNIFVKCICILRLRGISTERQLEP